MTLSIALLSLAIILCFFTFFTVEQQSTALIQRFGKFVRVSKSGLNLKIPFIESLVGIINLRVQQLDVKVETKTEDNVFVHIIVSVQFFANPDKIYEAFYKLDNPTMQITSFVFDVVRAKVPTIKLDDLFVKKDEIADAVKKELVEVMDGFGYGILKALVTDINPNEKVKESMNEINAAQRLRIAANEKGEAEKILKVKAAEGEAESKALQGQGIARQREAIIDGLQKSVSALSIGVPGVTTQDVLNLVLITQYFDTIKEIGASAKSNTVMLNHSPSAISDLASQITNSMLIANQVGRVDGGENS